MKILLLGHKGYLGSYLYQHLQVDILDLPLRKLVNNHKLYDYVINCIGTPNLEYCESHIEKTNYSNWLVLKDVKTFYPKAKIINFSSYYVYDDEGFCSESANATDQYVYTRQKLLGEKEVIKGVSFRIGKLFGNPHANQEKLTEYILSNSEIKLDDVTFNPTSVQQVLKVINYELHNSSLSGVYNLSNKGTTTHYEYGVFINALLGTQKNIERVSKIDRSFDNYGRFAMSVEKLSKLVSLTPWQDDMKVYLIQLLKKDKKTV